MATLLCLPSYRFEPAEEPEGVFSVASNKPDAFSPSDQQFISACANLMGVIDYFLTRIFEPYMQRQREAAEQELERGGDVGQIEGAGAEGDEPRQPNE